MNTSGINAAALNGAAGILATGQAGLALSGPSALVRLFPPVADDLPRAPTYYHCTLTGASDGLADAVLPIASFSVRHRVNTRSYFQIVVPSYAYASAIADRPNGQIVITQTTGGITEELMRGPIGDIPTARGAHSQSITISGDASRAAQDRRTYVLSAVSYIATDAEGNTRLRIAPRAAIRPGDAIVYDGTLIDVGLVSWSVSASQGGITASMEIATEPAELPA